VTPTKRIDYNRIRECIVEQKDATDEQAAVNEINSGILVLMCVF